MKASEIVKNLAVRLPQLTDKFTGEVSVRSLTRSGSVVTAACDAEHKLEPGDGVAINGAVELIDITSFSRDGTVGTIVTTSDHDLTKKTSEDLTVVTRGAVEAEFNGSFVATSVENRRMILVTMADSGSSPATGSPQLEGAESILRRYDSTYPVLETPDAVTFTFTQTDTTLADPVGTIVARTKPRISAGVSLERLVESYTEQEEDRIWAFVVLEDVAASKSRDQRSDAVDNLQPGDNFRQQILQVFTVYVFIPASHTIAGAETRDQAEDLFRPICQSTLALPYDSGLFVAASQGPAQFVVHGQAFYNGALYVHEYQFQQVVDLTFDDTVGDEPNVAFRDLDFTVDPSNVGPITGGVLTATIDLDDVPLP